ncbi:hypothetical protein Tco_0640206 [Tanacetum coccineum]
MFDEYFTPPSIVVSLVQEVAAPSAVVLADVSTSIDHDAPSTSIPSTQEQEHSLNHFSRHLASAYPATSTLKSMFEVLQRSRVCRRFGFHPTEWQEFRQTSTSLGSRRETYYGICLVVPGVQVNKRRFLL